MINRHLTLRLLALMSALGTSHQALAQTSAAAPASSEVVTLEKLDVNAVPIEENIMPTSRPFGSVYGTDRNILDTPRNVTIISREQLNAIGILETRDFSKLTASSYTQTNFGLPSNPSIRGLTADVLVNGMRRGLTVNGNGMPINFNSIESINIIKGFGNVMYGASSYAGGYADFVTKKPFFDKMHGSFEVTAGSFDVYRWTTDVGGPVNDKLAYRISYSGEDSKGYYYNGKKKTEAIYGATEWRPNDKYTLEANAEFYVADFTENWGINRVTQDLIDNGNYIPDAGTDAAYVAAINNIGGGFNSVRPKGTPVKLNRRVRLLAPGDDSYGKNVTAQVIQTVKLAGDAKLVNNTFFNYIDRDTFSSYYYNSVHRDNWGLENRFQYENTFETGSLENKVAAGFGLRRQEVWAVDDFWHEPVNSFDLTRNANLNRVPASAFGDSNSAQPPFNNFNPALPIPGYGPRGSLPTRYATPGATYGFDPASGNVYLYDDLSSNDSKLSQVSPFYQHDLIISEKFSVLGGARADILYVENTDPLPPPGYTAASDDITVVMPSGNLSFVYKPVQRVSTYYTFAYTTTNRAGPLGGGYTFTPVAWGGDGRTFTKEYFQQDNYLNEVGSKVSFLNNTLFIGAAVYAQTQFDNDNGGLNRWKKAQGFEIEANYQPSKNLFLTTSYSYIDSQQRYAGFLADSTSYDKRAVGAPTPDFPTITSSFQQPGIPEHLINALASYKFNSGFSFSLGAVVTGPMLTSQVGTGFVGSTPVAFTANEIPWQITVDGSVGYAWKRWSSKLMVRNLTNEENWSSPNPGYGNGSINADPERTYELTLAYKF